MRAFKKTIGVILKFMAMFVKNSRIKATFAVVIAM